MKKFKGHMAIFSETGVESGRAYCNVETWVEERTAPLSSDSEPR
jgi:hypothetical protein